MDVEIISILVGKI